MRYEIGYFGAPIGRANDPLEVQSDRPRHGLADRNWATPLVKNRQVSLQRTFVLKACIRMERLIEGIHQFTESVFDTKKQLFERLAKGQKPLALFITCSDSRVDPALLTQTKPSELFVIRSAGNIVPPYSTQAGGESATVEYAVAPL